MKSFRHWTPRYLFDRTALAVQHRRRGSDPWLTRTAILVLDEWLRKSDRGVEWGSGRSTPWFALRVDALMSIEHDVRWAGSVRTTLERAGLADRVDYRLVEPAEGPYVAPVEEFEDDTLDFALVDGIFRDACTLTAMRKLKPGGLLVIDNAERYFPRETPSRAPRARTVARGYPSAGWKQVDDALQSWRSVWTSNGIWDTALWVKPSR